MTQMNDTNPWQTLSSKEHYDNPWIRITEHQVVHRAGKEGIYGTIHFKHLAIGILPLDESYHTWLVGQYRYPLKTYSWEIPAGGGKLNMDPLDAAKRELREETGIQAKQWQKILEMHLSNSVSDEKALLYLATQLEFGKSQPDNDEELIIKKTPLAQAVKMVQSGEITDSVSVGAILQVETLRLSGALPPHSP